MNAAMQTKEIPETSTATSWYANALNYCLSLGKGIEGLFSFLRFSKWISTFLKWLSPVAIIASWATTANAFKNLYQAENRNFERYFDVITSLGTSIAWTVIYAAGVTIGTSIIAATTYFALHVLPWFAVGVFAVNASYGVFNIGKNLYRAVKAENSEARKNYLWQAAKQIPNILVNTMAGIASFLLGVKTSELISKLTWFGNNTPILQKITAVAQTAKKYIYALTGSVVAGVAINAYEMNKKTWHAIKNPKETLKKAYHKLRNNPLQIVPMIANTTLRVAVVATAPIQLLAFGIKKGISFLWNKIAPKKQNDKAQEVVNPPMEVADVNEQNPAVPQQVDVLPALKTTVAKIQNKLKKLEEQNTVAPSKIRQAKIYLLEQVLTKKMGFSKEGNIESYQPQFFQKDVSLKFIEIQAKNKSREVYSSFFRNVGEVKVLVNEVYAREREINNLQQMAGAA